MREMTDKELEEYEKEYTKEHERNRLIQQGYDQCFVEIQNKAWHFAKNYLILVVLWAGIAMLSSELGFLEVVTFIAVASFGCGIVALAIFVYTGHF